MCGRGSSVKCSKCLAVALFDVWFVKLKPMMPPSLLTRFDFGQLFEEDVSH